MTTDPESPEQKAAKDRKETNQRGGLGLSPGWWKSRKRLSLLPCEDVPSRPRGGKKKGGLLLVDAKKAEKEGCLNWRWMFKAQKGCLVWLMRKTDKRGGLFWCLILKGFSPFQKQEPTAGIHWQQERPVTKVTTLLTCGVKTAGLWRHASLSADPLGICKDPTGIPKDLGDAQEALMLSGILRRISGDWKNARNMSAAHRGHGTRIRPRARCRRAASRMLTVSTEVTISQWGGLEKMKRLDIPSGFRSAENNGSGRERTWNPKGRGVLCPSWRVESLNCRGAWSSIRDLSNQVSWGGHLWTRALVTH